MSRLPEPPTDESPSAHSNKNVEDQLSWDGGGVLMRTQAAQGSCARNLVRGDLTIAISFQNAGSDVEWTLDGKRALSRSSWSSTTSSRDLVILPPGCNFQVNCRGSGQGLWLFVDPENLVDDQQLKAIMEVPAVDDTWARDRLSWLIASEIRNECSNGFPRGTMFIEGATSVFLAQLARIFHKIDVPGDAPRALDKTRLQKVTDYLESHLDRNVSLSELSTLIGVTPRYFSGSFKRALGRPPHQYLLELRVARAKTLLCESNLRLIDIALAVGFNSQSHFNDCFRRMAGVTPARFRDETYRRGIGSR